MMDEKNLKQLEAFGYTDVKPIKHYTFNMASSAMNLFSNKVLNYYDAIQKCTEDLIIQGLIDGSIQSFEECTEAFKNITTMLFIEMGIMPPQYLAECIKLFRKHFTCDEN